MAVTDGDVQQRVTETLTGTGISPEVLDDLAGQLLWRIGRVSDEGPVTVRVGLASSAGLFHELPRLRTASDSEIEAAVNDSSLRVEWVGPRPRGASER